MNIVVEGPDNAGKSTLVECIARMLRWNVVSSEGPTRTQEELNDRARRFLSLDHTVFDRHCIVSEQIYGTMRGQVMTDLDLVRKFKASSKVIIYCRSDGTLSSHIRKEHDTDEHLEMVERRFQQICAYYDQWALDYANIIYRKGEPPMRVLRFLQGELSK
jgi:predicted ATPase